MRLNSTAGPDGVFDAHRNVVQLNSEILSPFHSVSPLLKYKGKSRISILREFIWHKNKLEERHNKNNYKTERDYANHFIQLCKNFKTLGTEMGINYAKGLNRLKEFYEKCVNELQAGDVWLDGGAGSARAQRELRTQERKGSNREKYPAYVSVGLTIPTAFREIISAFEADSINDFYYYEGVGIQNSGKKGRELREKIQAHGKVKLITDFMGGLSYADLDRVIQSYANLMCQDGHVILHTSKITIVDRKGNSVTLKEWINSIPGLEVVDFVHVIDRGQTYNDDSWFISFKKTCDANVIVPPLYIVVLESGIPPSRTYST